MTTTADFHIQRVADSYALLRTLPADCADITITDPPYTAHVQRNMSGGTAKKGTRNIPSAVPDFAPLAVVDPFAFIGDLLRVTKRWIVLFCSIESLGIIQQAYPNEYVRGCVWLKPNSMGQLTGDRPACAFEGIALLHKQGTKKRWGGRGSYGVWKCNGTRGLKGRHPNEKPLALCQKLIALFSEQGEVVFDPFCGSAAIGQAALSLGRGYMGWDQSEGWVTRARERLETTRETMTDTAALGLCQAFGEPPRATAAAVRLRAA